MNSVPVHPEQSRRSREPLAKPSLWEKADGKAFLIWLLLILFVPMSVLVAQKVGTTSLQFLKVMPAARATAMGDAFGTLASGADAVFWNPAGIAESKGIEISATFTKWLFDSRQQAAAVLVPLEEWGTIAFQLQYVDYGTIEVTRVDQLQFVGSGADVHYNPGLTGETFSPSTYLIGVTFAKQLTDKFSTGASVKLVNESLWGSSSATVIGSNGVPEKVNTFARLVLFDFGMHYNTGYRTIRVGVSVQNFGSQVKFAKESYPAPLAFRIGTAADILGVNALLGESGESRLTAAYDLFQPNDYAQQMNVGLEFAFTDVFFLRAGYKINYDNDNLTFGGGVRYPIAEVPLTIDYSYGNMGEYLPSVHRISLGVQFK
jgi:hypothetical protein